MDDRRVKIRFETTDGLGNSYVQESNIEIDSEMGFTFPEEAGRLLNLLLKQMTFARENDYIFMEDVTEDEMDALYDFLQEYRREKGKGE